MKKITSIAIVALLVLSTSAVTNPALAKSKGKSGGSSSGGSSGGSSSGKSGGSSGGSSSGSSGGSSSSSRGSSATVSSPPVTRTSPSTSVVVKAPVSTPKSNPIPPYYPPNISVQSKPSPLPTHIQQLKDPVAQKAGGSSTFVYQSGSSYPKTTQQSSSYTVTSSAANKAQTQLGGAKILLAPSSNNTSEQLNDKPIFNPCWSGGSDCSGKKTPSNPNQSDTAKVVDGLTYTPGTNGLLIGGKFDENNKGQVSKSSVFKVGQTVFVDKDKNAKETAKNTNALIQKGLTEISFDGYASPEGSASNNSTLSYKRAVVQMDNYRDDLKNQGWTCAGSCGTKDGKVTMINLQGKFVYLSAYGRGEVQPTTGGALGAFFDTAASAGCTSNSQSGCSAKFAPMRTTIVTASKPGTLLTPIKPGIPEKPPICTPGPCGGGGPTKIDSTSQTETVGETTRTASPVTPKGLPVPVVNPAQVQPGGSTTTSRLPGAGGVTGGRTGTSTPTSGVGSTTSSGSNSSSSTGTPTSGVNGTSTSSSTGSTLLPPASGFGSTPSTGSSTSTPTTGGSSSNPTLAPRFKVS